MVEKPKSKSSVNDAIRDAEKVALRMRRRGPIGASSGICDCGSCWDCGGAESYTKNVVSTVSGVKQVP